MRRALYIGRFQIFHLGHVDVVQQIDRAPDVGEIVLAIGSAQYDHRRKSPAAPWAFNPFTVEERREMIERSLAGKVSKPWSLQPIDDAFPDHEAWYRLLTAELPEIDVLYTSDRSEARLFESKGKLVRGFEKRFDFHAGLVRRWIADGKPFRHAVAPEAAAVLDRIGAAERLASLFRKDRDDA